MARMELIRRVSRRSLALVGLLGVGSIFLKGQNLPPSVLVGGVLGVINIRWMARGLGPLLGETPPASKIWFLSAFRLVIICTIIIALAATGRLNLLAFLAGFSAVVAVVVWEGAQAARKEMAAQKATEAPQDNSDETSD